MSNTRIGAAGFLMGIVVTIIIVPASVGPTIGSTMLAIMGSIGIAGAITIFGKQMAKKPAPKPSTKVANHLSNFFGISPKEARKFGREAVKALGKKP